MTYKISQKSILTDKNHITGTKLPEGPLRSREKIVWQICLVNKSTHLGNSEVDFEAGEISDD